MKLELKHLAEYFPYGLKAEINYKRIDKIIEKRVAIINLIDSVWNRCNLNNGSISYNLIYFDEIKPILRPLSDLTKEIEHNGEKFLPIDKINEYDETAMSYSLSFYEDCTLRLPYYIIRYLFKWHFDIYGLIEKGLAIDINTINK